MMKAARSFRPTSGDLPNRYRTPSPPPREAIEPLSPHPDTGYLDWVPEPGAYTNQGLGLSLCTSDSAQTGLGFEQQLWVDGNGQAQIESFNSTAPRNNATRRNTYDEYRASSRKEGYHKRDRKGHARAGSSMDALATIALATSPTFSQGSPTFPQSPWPGHTYSNGYQHDYTLDERSSKRAKSEKLPSPQMTRKQSRPSTSHVTTSLESLKDDAELLLNFAQPHNFPPLHKITPPQRPQVEQESPPYKRLSASTTASERIGEDVHNLDQEDTHKAQQQSGHAIQPEPTEDNKPQSGVANDGQDTHTKQEINTDRDIVEGLKNADSDPPAQTQASTSLEEQLSASAAEVSAAEEKKPRRVQPTTQAPCAKCNSLQATPGTEEQDGMTSWIGCNGCQRWFHIVCAGFKDSREVRTVDKYICRECEPTKGQTTYVRKSSRARTAIDYAGLNQGMIQFSEETPEHHWLKPIKDGRIKFQPDDFARIRPELLTTDFLEKTDGFKRPLVIPGCWNPQFGRKREEVSNTNEDEKPDENEIIIDSEGNEVSSAIMDSSLSDQEEVIDCGQDLLDMVMPEHLTVRRVAELHGLDMPLDVIDVKSQQTAQKWNLKKWADYYESTGEKTIRNVISLEVSQSKLGRLLQRPKIVRDLDLQDAVWPPEVSCKAVQFYCLMSVADCYTDFHIDFGGSSVYYHILKGKKTFFFIPPEDKHLKKYEQWNNSPLQNQTFLGDETGDCSRVDLSEGDTMLIPSGWIHAVWTPENSLVIGGNFLTRMSYEMQIKVNRIEIDTKTALKFRYPLFQKVNWYAAIRYLEDDPVPEEVLHDFEDDPDHVFLRANPVWHEFGDLKTDVEPGDPFFNARFYSRMEIEGLPALRDYLYRTALIASDFHVDGVTETGRTNVKKSIPKGHGEPMDLIRTFGIWVAWKTGCVTAPDWVRPDSQSLASLARKAEKQKKADIRTPGERMSSRVQSQLEHARAESAETPTKRQLTPVESEATKEDTKRPKRTPKTSGLGPQRFACDPCRKRRIRCRHRDGNIPGSTTDSGGPRAYSSTTVEIPRPMPAQSIPGLDGPSSSPQAKATEPMTNSDPVSMSLPVPEVNGNNSQPTPVQQQIQESMVAGTSSGKKGRSKACDECRKSKRRCIHDENGKVDPFKAAEPSKPRGSSSSKRPRLSDEFNLAVKKSKVDYADTDTILVDQVQSALAEAMNETAVEDDFNSLIDPSLRPAIQQLQAATDAITQSANEMNEAAGPDPTPDHAMTDNPAESPAQANLTIQIDSQPHISPTSVKTEPHPATLTASSSEISAHSLVSPPDSHRNDDEDFPLADNNPDTNKSVEPNVEGSITSSNDSTINPLQTPISAASRHSSRQPKPVDRYVPDAVPTLSAENGVKQQSSKSFTTAANLGVKKENRRASSSGASVGTTGSLGNLHLNSNSQSSSTGAGTSSKASRASTSATSSTSLQQETTSPSSSSRPAVNAGDSVSGKNPIINDINGTTMDSISPSSHAQVQGQGQIAVQDVDADEESLRLIRALQEEEFGLRRRRSMKA